MDRAACHVALSFLVPRPSKPIPPKKKLKPKLRKHPNTTQVNIGNARLYGMEEDLNLTGNDFSVAVSILSVGFVQLLNPLQAKQ